MKNNTKQMVIGGLIAALYVVLTIGQNLLLPGSASAAVQFRVSEAMCVLALLTPTAIPSLTIGCLVANILAGLGAADLIFGPIATLAAVALMYLLRNIKLFSVPVMSLLMPALCNGILIGLEIALFFTDGGFSLSAFLFSAGCVALGEFAVLFALGIPLYLAINASSKFKQMLV